MCVHKILIRLDINFVKMGINTEHAGPEILIYLSIASPFSRQIAIGNAGPATALESMGGK